MQPCSNNVAELRVRPYRKGRWFYFTAELVCLAHAPTPTSSQASRSCVHTIPGFPIPWQAEQEAQPGTPLYISWGFRLVGMFWFWMYPLLVVVRDYLLSSLFPSYPTSGIIRIYFLSFASFSGCFEAPSFFYSPLFSRTEKLHVDLAWLWWPASLGAKNMYPFYLFFHLVLPHSIIPFILHSDWFWYFYYRFLLIQETDNCKRPWWSPWGISTVLWRSILSLILLVELWALHHSHRNLCLIVLGAVIWHSVNLLQSICLFLCTHSDCWRLLDVGLQLYQ